jgi:hypothetical protein
VGEDRNPEGLARVINEQWDSVAALVKLIAKLPATQSPQA